jgi:outer membrane protein OmpA-like peptidoglycan-associated protein
MGAVFAVSSAVAADPSVTPPDAFVKALQAAPCPSGHPRNKNGLCPAVSTDTEGFTLFDAAPSNSAKVASPRRTRVVTAINRPREAPLDTTSGSDPLSDLRIGFKLGSSDLTEHGKAQARSFAKALLNPALANIHVEIAGHTDASGTETLNLALSQARANAVKDYLVVQGVDASRLTAKGYGSQQLAVPSAPNDPANRRVEARRLD